MKWFEVTRINKTSYDVDTCDRRERVGKSERTRDILKRFVVARYSMYWDEILENCTGRGRRNEPDVR